MLVSVNTMMTIIDLSIRHFVLRFYPLPVSVIAARTDEGDCTAISQRVYTSVAAFNNKLQSDMSGKSSL